MLFKSCYLNSSVTLEGQEGILTRNQLACPWSCNLVASLLENIYTHVSDIASQNFISEFLLL